MAEPPAPGASAAPSGAGSHAGPTVPSPEEGVARTHHDAGPHPVRVAALAVAVTLALLVLTQVFLVRMFHVPSASMEPTLRPGDRVAVGLWAPGPLALERGDVVVFEDTQAWLTGAEALQADPLHAALQLVSPGAGEGHLVKRVIGLPGDTVAWRPGWEHLQVDGRPLPEPYLAGEPAEEAFEVTVPEGRLFVLGDHRAASQDSRQHRDGPGGGFVAVDDVVGRVEAVVWPPARIGGLDDAAPEGGDPDVGAVGDPGEGR